MHDIVAFIIGIWLCLAAIVFGGRGKLGWAMAALGAGCSIIAIVIYLASKGSTC